jgi:2-dehydropantoate 2-reductase
VIVTMKANALAAIAGGLKSLAGADTLFVFAQNGIPWWYGIGISAERKKTLPDLSRLDPGGALARAVRPESVAGAVVYSANDAVEPGVVVNHTAGSNMLVVGAADDAVSEKLSLLRDCLEKAGMSSPPASDIRQAVWNKAVVNLGTSTVSVLAESALGPMRADAAMRELLARLAAEGKAIARAHGVDPEQAPQRPGGGHSSGNIAHKTSMLQDYERGRPMEIEAQLMAPLAFARAAGVATPALDALVPIAAFKAAQKGLYSR